ncbi:MAG: glycoside hydrolase family 3 C-terminal domain-containing protein [Sphingobacteriales bacterium]|nr:glycoside hydrolase family 3 C-terminal domain-containing protein [Sphingobacteriales bacterium]
MKRLLTIMAVLSLPVYSISQSPAAKALVAKMTLEEKVNLVVGMGMNIPGLNNGAPVVGQTADKVPGAAGTTFAIPRLGIPATVLADGPAGLRIEPKRKDDPRTYYATAWPVGTLLASTWDTELVGKVGRAMGNEVREYAADVLLAPALNIHRNSLGGRNFEYYSEDPLVAGKMAAAMVNGIERNGVGTSIKHFAANNQETNRNTVNTILSERALREIYLKGFQITVKEAQPWTVMSSYNLINGTYTSEDYNLLSTILRKEWGFKGIVMTDWFGGKDAVAQMKAGNDLLMPGRPDQKKAITNAVIQGTLPGSVLDLNAGRIVDYILGSPAYKKYAFSNKPDLKAHAALARTAASAGIILLKNENQALPLKNNLRLAAYGNTSYSFIAGGTGSGDVNEAYTISLVQGLETAGYQLNNEILNTYKKYLDDYTAQHPKKEFIREMMDPTPAAPEFDKYSALLSTKTDLTDAALITIGRNAGEFRDRKKENDFYLSEQETSLIKNVAEAYHQKGKNVIVVINSGGMIDIASWSNYADAIVLAWQGGQEAGNAVADILSGKVNPSGKLATSIPVRYEDEASSKNFPGIEFPEKASTGMLGMKAIPAEVIYEEGIYVGYRYFSTFNIKPAYAFGYGLSYTNFSYGALKLSSPLLHGKISAGISVTNTGKTAGKEVVQLYITAPGKTLDKPAIELKAFAKTKLLAPGETQTLRFEISASDLASYDATRSVWVAEAGEYQLKAGSSSDRILQTAHLTLAKEVITEKCHKVMAPTVTFNELKK